MMKYFFILILMTQLDAGVLKFSTASKYGSYHAWAKKCVQDASKVTLLPSGGSLENIKRLHDKKVDMAFVQQDVLDLMQEIQEINIKHSSFSFGGEGYKYIGLKNYKENIYFLVKKRKDTFVTIKDNTYFKNKKIAIGAVGGGTYITGNLLKSKLWSISAIPIETVGYSKLSNALVLLDNEKIDIVLYVTKDINNVLKSVGKTMKQNITMLNFKKDFINPIYPINQTKFGIDLKAVKTLYTTPSLIFRKDINISDYIKLSDSKCF